ncbi:hypothetical protein H5410_013613 [Solanum commersonii]|uniref:Uncharacterized protein n=1 Tax=Solanum commersonii TaxID=4109 RepID=A0A9J5ZNN3_SOLCO|nr:hypothetical protein H5410_013613 [Solanum commersonii]
MANPKQSTISSSSQAGYKTRSSVDTNCEEVKKEKSPEVLVFPKGQHPVTPSLLRGNDSVKEKIADSFDVSEVATSCDAVILRGNDSQASTFSGDQQRPSRLQRLAPASIQINCATDWNVVSGSKEEVKKEKSPAVLVFKKWQHPERKQPLYDSTSSRYE